MPINTSEIISIKGITNDSIDTLGTLNLTLMLSHPLRHKFYLVPDQFNINTDGILGKDFLTMHNCVLDYNNMKFRIKTHENILQLRTGPSKNTLIIPPRCEVIRKFTIETSDDVVVDHTIFAPGVYSSRTIINSDNPYLRVINTTDTPQLISSKLTHYDPLNNYNCCH